MRYQIIDTEDNNRILAETNDPIEAEMIVKEHELMMHEPDSEMGEYFRDYWIEEVRKAHAAMEDESDDYEDKLVEDIIDILTENETCTQSKTA